MSPQGGTGDASAGLRVAGFASAEGRPLFSRGLKGKHGIARGRAKVACATERRPGNRHRTAAAIRMERAVRFGLGGMPVDGGVVSSAERMLRRDTQDFASSPCGDGRASRANFGRPYRDGHRFATISGLKKTPLFPPFLGN